MFNNQNPISTLIKNTIKEKLSTVQSNLDITGLEDSILDDLNEQLSISPNLDPTTLVTQLVNNNNQIQQILTSDQQLKDNPSNSQSLTPAKIFTQPNFQFGVNISIDDLSTAIRKLLVENFNNQFNTSHLYSDFSFTTVPAKETFQCAYLLNKDNIYLRVDINTFYGGSFTKVDSFILNSVPGNNTDIVYTSTGVMGNDVYKLGNLEFKKYCQVVTPNPTIYNDVFIPVVLLDDIPYALISQTDFKQTIMQQLNESGITIDGIKAPSFYLDESGSININFLNNDSLFNYVYNFSDGALPFNNNPFTFSSSFNNSNDYYNSFLNLCNKNVITSGDNGFEVYDYQTGNSTVLDPSSYSYTQANDGVFFNQKVIMGGVVTDTDGSCLPVYVYSYNNASLYNTNVNTNTTYQYTILNTDGSTLLGNYFDQGNVNKIKATTIPNFLTTTTNTSTVYDKLCNTESYSNVKDFVVMTQVRTTSLGNTVSDPAILDINLLVANAKDAYYSNVNINITDTINSYFAKYLADQELSFTIPQYNLADATPVITGIDQDGYASIAILVYLTSIEGYYIQGIITLNKNFEAQDFFLVNKIYNEDTTPLNYRQSNYVLQPVNIAGTSCNILMAIERNDNINLDSFIQIDEDKAFSTTKYPYFSLIYFNSNLSLIRVEKNNLGTKLYITMQYQDYEGVENRTLISKLMTSDGSEPISNNSTPNQGLA